MGPDIIALIPNVYLPSDRQPVFFVQIFARIRNFASLSSMAVVSSSSFLSFSHGGVYGRCHFSCPRRGKVSSAAFFRVCSRSELHAASVTGNSDPVEVIGIGSRKDAVMDFCLSSSSLSSSLSRLRFW